jgi:Zn-dependent alcohol dehydrogenase
MGTLPTAILTNGRGEFFLDQVALGDPGPGEVLVEIHASGVCHTDYDTMRWGRTMVMGHEGAGIVLACGKEVTHVQSGDRVLLNWAMPCGLCFQCRQGAENICEAKLSVPSVRFVHNGTNIFTSFDLGTMSAHTVVPWQAVVKIDVEIPFPSAAILGCGVVTGWGSVVNAARVEKGSSAVVLGCGGVGLSVVQGAVHACASKIIAVELNRHRLDLAVQFGATHTPSSLHATIQGCSKPLPKSASSLSVAPTMPLNAPPSRHWEQRRWPWSVMAAWPWLSAASKSSPPSTCSSSSGTSITSIRSMANAALLSTFQCCSRSISSAV